MAFCRTMVSNVISFGLFSCTVFSFRIFWAVVTASPKLVSYELSRVPRIFSMVSRRFFILKMNYNFKNLILNEISEYLLFWWSCKYFFIFFRFSRLPITFSVFFKLATPLHRNFLVVRCRCGRFSWRQIRHRFSLFWFDMRMMSWGSCRGAYWAPFKGLNSKRNYYYEYSKNLSQKIFY